MRQRKSILTDPRYEEFCLRYWDDPYKYACEIAPSLLEVPSPSFQTAELFKAVSSPGSRTSVSSGHGTGKSVSYALLADWHLRVYPMSNTLITANNVDQIRSVVWKYLSQIISAVDACYPWMSGYFEKETKRYYCKGCKDDWFVIPKTAAKYKPESIAGMHNPQYLLLVDEAASIDDLIMQTVMGALTEPDNRAVLCSQYTRLSGFFHETFNSYKEIWTNLEFNAEESPFVTKEFIRDCLIMYGGHHSPEYQVRVLGRRADNMSGFLIPRSWCDEAQTTQISHDTPYGWVISVDVSEGVYRDSSVITVAKVSGYDDERQVEVVRYSEYLHLNPKELAPLIYQEYASLPMATVICDSDGPGLTTVLELEDLGVNLERVHWGRPCHSQAHRNRYQDQRAYACVSARKAIFDGRLRLPGGQRAAEQASKIPYEFDERLRYVIAPKAKMAADGIKSPDIFDTVCFFFLSTYTPAESERAGGKESEMLEEVRKMLQMEQ